MWWKCKQSIILSLLLMLILSGCGKRVIQNSESLLLRDNYYDRIVKEQLNLMSFQQIYGVVTKDSTDSTKDGITVKTEFHYAVDDTKFIMLNNMYSCELTTNPVTESFYIYDEDDDIWSITKLSSSDFEMNYDAEFVNDLNKSLSNSSYIKGIWYYPVVTESNIISSTDVQTTTDIHSVLSNYVKYSDMVSEVELNAKEYDFLELVADIDAQEHSLLYVFDKETYELLLIVDVFDVSETKIDLQNNSDFNYNVNLFIPRSMEYITNKLDKIKKNTVEIQSEV